YVVYGDMILLPPNAFDGPLGTTPLLQADVDPMYKLISRHLKVTHIATTKPIPLLNSDDAGEENVLRSPKDFTTLYGDFGPATASDPPTQEDFDNAYWVTAKQNGIYQTWAPRWTMFSRGNISEKARLLTLPSLLSAIEDGEAGTGCTAVDLYAGVGYFAFSYLKAGFDKVVCWDLSSWSVEGLMRGARANNWKALRVASEAEMDEACQNKEVRLLAFSEGNERASERIANMRRELPPVRHVNCGLLPSSKGSWQTAVEVLDCEHTGWLHVHENFAVGEIEQKAEDVRQRIEELVNERRCGNITDMARVTLLHVNRLKSYAPGVTHCVIDIQVAPLQ
ncbi:hypothetical protein BAUCODRAFT_47065, partial [Baudoinia panamericana UAMH 10762]